MSPKAKSPKKQRPDRHVVASNRKARHDFEILDTYECGIVLKGSEVKSLRDAKVQLRDSYARVEDGEVWLHGVHISPYVFASGFGGHDPDRKRKLLLHRREIAELDVKLSTQPLTLVPLSIYFKENKAKVELGLARGKKLYDKRHAMAERDANREAERAMARSRSGKSGGWDRE
ncbi:MAG TPA: SsrA-binding protein SmpB [Acidimicrobiales bacterium]|jgi:SsrA-binding protein|nr:SsrA-binding protein SmpB [Acidimicrobiales bacterium]